MTTTNKTMLSECTTLFDKAKKLSNSECLYTSFGPDACYTIEKRDNTFVLKIWDAYKVFKYKPKDKIKLKSPSDLVFWLLSEPHHYARNVFSRQDVHFNNWINLISAFRVRQYSEEDKYKN